MLDVLARLSGAGPVERLLCHPRLPLVAALSADRPLVHVWDTGTGQHHEIAAPGRDRSVAWHPAEPELLVSRPDGITRWTPDGTADLDGIRAGYRDLAFSPDGSRVWASPSPGTYGSSDVIDPGAGVVATGPYWDTGVAVHPAGGLVLTFRSDQGETLGLFGRPQPDGTMRLLRLALSLDVDGYETPVFSADGRHLAVRGDAYGHTVDVFAFPSLERVLAATLDSSSRHALAFGTDPGVLWAGFPDGDVLAIPLGGGEPVRHEVLPGTAVTALAAAAGGGFVVAGGDDLVRTDGVQTWTEDDLDTVTEEQPGDPTWLRIRISLNRSDPAS